MDEDETTYVFFPNLTVSLNSVWDEEEASSGTAQATLWMKDPGTGDFRDITDHEYGGNEYTYDAGSSTWDVSLMSTPVSISDTQDSVTLEVDINYTNKDGESGSVQKTYEFYLNNLITADQSGDHPKGYTIDGTSVTFYYKLNDAAQDLTLNLLGGALTVFENASAESGNDYFSPDTAIITEGGETLVTLTFNNVPDLTEDSAFILEAYYDVSDSANGLTYYYDQHDQVNF